MPRSHPPYAPEFRRQMVELVRTGQERIRWKTTGGHHQMAVASSTATLGLGWDRGPEY